MHPPTLWLRCRWSRGSSLEPQGQRCGAERQAAATVLSNHPHSALYLGSWSRPEFVSCHTPDTPHSGRFALSPCLDEKSSGPVRLMDRIFSFFLCLGAFRFRLIGREEGHSSQCPSPANVLGQVYMLSTWQMIKTIRMAGQNDNSQRPDRRLSMRIPGCPDLNDIENLLMLGGIRMGQR